jgi:hypothetical protein
MQIWLQAHFLDYALYFSSFIAKPAGNCKWPGLFSGVSDHHIMSKRPSAFCSHVGRPMTLPHDGLVQSVVSTHGRHPDWAIRRSRPIAAVSDFRPLPHSIANFLRPDCLPLTIKNGRLNHRRDHIYRLLASHVA